LLTTNLSALLELYEAMAIFQRTIEEEIEINASTDKVWNIVSDFASFPQWNTFVVKVELPNANGIKVGEPTSIEVALKAGDKPTTYQNTITKVEPNRELVWEGGFGLGVILGMKVQHFQVLTEGSKPGTCHYRQGEVFTGSLVPAAAMTSTFDDLKAAYARMNGELKGA
jgi:hypothetical protein